MSRHDDELVRRTRELEQRMGMGIGQHAVNIDPKSIKSDDACCPCCQNNRGRFIREPDGSVSLKCGGCGYKGPIQDFLTPERYAELVREGMQG